MSEVKLSFLLMGITGQGKSATGNKILNKDLFREGTNTMSQTKHVSFSFTQFGSYLLLVVDGPGLADTDLSEAEDRETTAKNMDQALAMCYGGVDAFLLVTKFSNRFTKQDNSALHDLKRIFGDRFMDHVIIVMTGGDTFQKEMKREERDISFEEWCREQRGAFRQLYDDCEGRAVLFNNREKDEEKKRAQTQQIVQLGQSLRARYGDRYTSQCFQDAEREREKLILEYNAPHLNETFQAKICLLSESIDRLISYPREEAKQEIKDRVQEVKLEIEKHDNGHGVLVNLQDQVNKVEENINNIEMLITLNRQLGKTRKAKKDWGIIGSVCTFVGGAICLAAPLAGVVVATLSSGATLINHLRLDSNERGFHKSKQEIEDKLKKESEDK